MWTQAVVKNMTLWIIRVSTHDNIADLPSRFEYGALREAGAVWRHPMLEEQYWAESAWKKWKSKNALLSEGLAASAAVP